VTEITMANGRSVAYGFVGGSGIKNLIKPKKKLLH
jgi:hypothetical protein